jgi:tetratricopeptide (TPR) repeat protein
VPRRLMLGVCALLAVSFTLGAVRALAEPPRVDDQTQKVTDGEEPAGYRELVEQALSEYAAKNYEEASALFTRAHALYPNARTLRGLGMAAFELRRYEESIGLLESALSAPAKALEGQLRADTETLLARAQSFVARVEVELSPSSATLAVDGKPVSYTARVPLLLGLGEHALSAEAEGYRPERKNLRVRGGEVVRVDLQLTANTLPLGTHEQRSDRPRRLVKSPWLWTAVGAVVVGAAVAGVLLATRDDPGQRTVPLAAPGGNRQTSPLQGLVFR